MKVLIVDDDFVSRSLIQTILKQHGITDMDMVVTGNEAFDAYCISREKGNPYTLIFLDIMMPESSGELALKKIRNFEREKIIDRNQFSKIIIVSSMENPEKIMENVREESDYYVGKPINEEKILKAMEKAGVSL